MSRHRIAVSCVLTIAAVSGGYSFLSCDWCWFQRSGSLTVIAGVVTEYWEVLKARKADDLPFWTL